VVRPQCKSVIILNSHCRERDERDLGRRESRLMTQPRPKLSRLTRAGASMRPILSRLLPCLFTNNQYSTWKITLRILNF
jgi:hypothetical protein